MAKDTRYWSPRAYYPYDNQSSWPPSDEEVDSQIDYATDGQRAYRASFDSGVGHSVGNGLPMTDSVAGPYTSDPSPGLHSPYHLAMDSARTRFAYYPQQPSGGPSASEISDLLGQREGCVDGSGLPGPYEYGVSQTDTPEEFRSLSQMSQEQGRDSPRSFASTGAEQGSDMECNSNEPRDPMPSRGHVYHFDPNSDPNEPWSPPVDQGRPSGIDRATDATAKFDSRFPAAESASNGRKHKKNRRQVAGTSARRDERHSGSKGSKSRPHETGDERHRLGQ